MNHPHTPDKTDDRRQDRDQSRQRDHHRDQERDRERGSITPLIAVLAATFIVLGGLIYDDGRADAAKATAIDEAQQAARTAAQALNPADLRNNILALAPSQAIADAQQYIASCGDTGTVTISGDEITVHVTRRQPTAFLDAIGISEITVTGTATAELEQGVTTSAGFTP
jgi:cytoskeletal protein RodZ